VRGGQTALALAPRALGHDTRAVTSLRLPLLEPHRASLETCVYCPKLSRAACPVSNVEANETVTPWGKMSITYFAARGDVPIDEGHAAPAWACTACYACRERCDHKNEVAPVLTAARAEFFERGVAPAGAALVSARWSDRAEALGRAVNELDGGGREGAHAAVLIGCGYVRHAREVAEDALRATEALLGEAARPLRACCGLPLLYAGDHRGFGQAARVLAAEVEGAKELVAVDPGCARALLVEYPRVGVEIRAPSIFVDLAARAQHRLIPKAASRGDEAVRYHDPCQLGRGLGRYDEPRALLTRITGQPPAPFLRQREHGECSGAGGLLPATRPETSRAIADARITEHRSLGGGALVTACAASLHRFRTRGEPAVDLVSLVAGALSGRAPGPRRDR
jgi:dimethylglycine catabolism B